MIVLTLIGGGIQAAEQPKNLLGKVYHKTMQFIDEHPFITLCVVGCGAEATRQTIVGLLSSSNVVRQQLEPVQRLINNNAARAYPKTTAVRSLYEVAVAGPTDNHRRAAINFLSDLAAQ